MRKDGSPSRLDVLPSGAFPPKEERKEARLLKQKKRRDDALCLLILSGFSLVLGLVFLFLSFRYNFLHERCFVPGSLEFVVCLIAFLAFLILFGFGLYKLISSLLRSRAIERE